MNFLTVGSILMTNTTDEPFPLQLNLLAEGAEGVAEGFSCQMEQSLQEHVDLQRVEALPFICSNRNRNTVERKDATMCREKAPNRTNDRPKVLFSV